MRWDGQTVELDEEGRLPGLGETAVVRRFDAPEALDTRFHEIRAKSALNRVPAASRVPFEWTVNPYRGCSHACVYCLGGDTEVLMEDGRTRPIRHLRPGDGIYGTEPAGAGRRYAVTHVLDHWMTSKPAYRVTLDNGQELVASGDHRFLTDGGWRHVVGSGRPHLSPGSRLMGPVTEGVPAGRAVATPPELRVVRIEPLVDEEPLYDITTGTGDFIANGVVSHNCFARPTHEYLEMDAGRDFEKEIIVKVNVPEVLRKELARPSWSGEHIAMGTNTDPYQWVEGRYKLMRGIWEVLRDAANPCSILTKSPLLLRDLDLMLEVAERTDIHACLSVPTLDEKAWRATEPHTPHPRARLEAVGKLNAAGIPTGILIAPLLPGINDAPDQIERIIALATEAGAVSIGGQVLFLAGSVREIYFDWLRSYRPDLVPWYEELYARGSRVPTRERRALERAAGLPVARMLADKARVRHRGAPRRLSPPPPRREEVRQERLF